MDYSLPWDRTTLAWTLGTCVFLLLVMGVFLNGYRGALRVGAPVWPSLTVVAISVISLLTLIAVAPLGLRLTGSVLAVRRLIGPARFDLARASSVEVVPYDSVFGPGTWRTFGVGGPFGLSGRFRSPALGSFRAAVTRRAPLVLVRFEDAPPLVVSPASPADLAEALRSARASAARPAS